MGPRAKHSILRTTLWFAIAGGFGIPALFILMWQILGRSLSGGALIDVMEWFESFRIMFWPSAMLLVFRAAGDVPGEWRDLLVAILVNIGLYSLIGLGMSLSLRTRLTQSITISVLLAGMFGANFFWSRHIASFLVAAVVLVMFFVLIFWKRDLTGNEATAGDPRRRD